jgi:thiamine pyrophosphate-dependent acetolactate synthase large subunit-like protein
VSAYRNGGAAVVATLAAHGVDTVFGEGPTAAEVGAT